jgi:hypothetical protein
VIRVTPNVETTADPINIRFDNQNGISNTNAHMKMKVATSDIIQNSPDATRKDAILNPIKPTIAISDQME